LVAWLRHWCGIPIRGEAVKWDMGAYMACVEQRYTAGGRNHRFIGDHTSQVQMARWAGVLVASKWYRALIKTSSRGGRRACGVHHAAYAILTVAGEEQRIAPAVPCPVAR